MKFKHTDFDGCMYGLVSRREGTDEVPTEGTYVLGDGSNTTEPYFDSASTHDD